MPAPVVPAISACGPSRTRSTSTTPSSDTPIGAAGAGSSPPDRHDAAIAAAVRGTPDRSPIRMSVVSSDPAPAGSSGSENPARRCAIRHAVSVASPATWRRSDPTAPSAGCQRARPRAPTSSTERQTAGTASPPSIVAIVVTGRSEARNRRSGLVRVASAAGTSVRTTTRRASSSSRSNASVSACESPCSNTVFVSCPVAACGSHAAQAWRATSSVITMRRQSAGPHCTASCTTSDRATAGASSPTIAMALPASAARSISIDTSRSRDAASTTDRRSGRSVSMSTPSGSSHLAEPQPARTRNASPWAGRRVQSPEVSGTSRRTHPSIASATARSRTAAALAASPMANRVHASTSRRRVRRRPRASRARPVPAAANAAIEPDRAEQREHRLAKDHRDRDRSEEADDGTSHPPAADHRLGRRRRRRDRHDGLRNGVTAPAQHRASPGITRRPAGRDGIGLGRWSGHQQTARADLDRHVMTYRRRPFDRAVTDDDRHPPGELEDRHRAIGMRRRARRGAARRAGR